jgi:hypothetical protein
MRTICLLVFFPLLFTSLTSKAQELSGIAALPESLFESSGLHFTNGRLLSIEDSGNDNVVIEIDTLTGNAIAEVSIGNAENTDWESITGDETFIYIGDFGNNNGSRQDLKIYKIPLGEYLAGDETQTLEVISFNFADQTSFTSSPFATNFDAEAFCAYGDSLILFSKNWINGYSKVYKLPKTPGEYTIEVIDSLNTEGFVTGCDCQFESGLIHLIGHNALLVPFAVRISDFSPHLITDGEINRVELSAPIGQSTQIEGLTLSYPGKFFVSSETFFNTSAWLFELDWDIDLSTKNPQKLYLDGFISPNPNDGNFRVDYDDFNELRIIDHNGRTIYSGEKSDQFRVNIDAGLYTVVLRNEMNHKVASQRLVIINE